MELASPPPQTLTVLGHYLGKEAVQNILVFGSPTRWSSAGCSEMTRGSAARG